MNYVRFCSNLVAAIKRKFGQELIAALIFGSYARLVPKKGSDVDLLIIVKQGANKDLLEIKKAVFKHLNASSDVIIMTKLEFQSGIRKADPLLVGVYSAYDSLIGRSWLKREFKKLAKVIKKKKVSLMIGGLLWGPKNLTN